LIDDPEDWIRRELAEALGAGVPVIPILADDATLPSPEELPADIAALGRCQYRRLRHRDVRSDVKRIVTDLIAADPELATVASSHRRAAHAGRAPSARHWLAVTVDPYRRRARIGPLLLTVLPAVLLSAAVLPGVDAAEQGAVLVLTGGLPILADQLGRARGKLLEPHLFQMWGGKPTTQLLRWSGPTGRARQERQHAALQRILGPHTRLPTADQERADPQGCDEVYDTAITAVRASQRGPGNLVFEENCNYGFRRNMLGLRPFGVLVAALAMVGMPTLWTFVIGTVHPATLLTAGVMDVVLLWFWIAIVKPAWVEQAAWAYAERLLEVVLPVELPPGQHQIRASRPAESGAD
jgi:hypothetical protein